MKAEPRASWRSVGAFAGLSLCFAGASAQTFRGLGAFPGGHTSVAYGLSADGNVVVGRAEIARGSPDGGDRAFRWTLTQGMEDLGLLPDGAFSVARAVSADGSTIVGVAGALPAGRAFRWSATEGMQDLGVLPGGHASDALAVNSAGSNVIGTCGYSSGASAAFRWTNDGGMLPLATPPVNGHLFSEVKASSGDGWWFVGSSWSPLSIVATRWGGDTQNLGVLAGGTGSEGTSISDDGSVVAGYSTSMIGTRAFRWTTLSGMESLGVVSGTTYSCARSVSPDGSVVVGFCNDPTVPESNLAFVWTQGMGMVDLNERLQLLGASLDGWVLSEAFDVTVVDRTIVIVGMGLHAGYTEAWIATLPRFCPADLDDGTGTGAPDDALDITDLLYFLGAFGAGSAAADLDNGTGNGISDGGIDINDLLYFLLRFEAGC